MTLFYIFVPAALLYFIASTTYIISFYKSKQKGWYKPLILFIFALFIFDISIIEPYSIKVRQENLILNKLEQPLKVVVISDIHLRPLKKTGFVNFTAEKIKRLNPDLIILAGDYLFFDNIDNYKDDLLNFKKFSDIAPTYAVLGNHDYGIGDAGQNSTFEDSHEKIIKDLEQADIKLLIDEKTKINIHNQDLWLVGFDEYWSKKSHPDKALSDLNDNLLKIGISHNPDNGLLPKNKILDIIVSGHTHGGQAGLPFIGPLANAETLFPEAEYGKFLPNNSPKMLNTSGLGESGLPIRFFNWPEIVLLTIK